MNTTPEITPEPTPTATPVPIETPTPVPTKEPALIIQPTSEPASLETSQAATNENATMVWIDKTAKRYHKANGCNMDNAYQVTLEEALAMGKTPCGRCYK